MTKKLKPDVVHFLNDIKTLNAIPTSKKYSHLHLKEYPFDEQLLKLSSLYRHSRHCYLAQGGKFNPRVSSMMRSLSAQDLFKDEIDYTPSMTELIWFKDHVAEVVDPSGQVKALTYFNENSVYHEQNHRILWKMLPPAPKDRNGLRRYLNFAESLVVTLDLALGDEVGEKLSAPLERMNLLYRPGEKNNYKKKSKNEYRKYLLSLLCTTYYALELIEHKDILKAVNYIFPNQNELNKVAVRRGLELSEFFTMNTNPQWQEMYWKEASKKLSAIHKKRAEPALVIAEDPLDLNFEFALARSIFDFYGL